MKKVSVSLPGGNGRMGKTLIGLIIENEKYDQFKALGNITVQSLIYMDADYPQGFTIHYAKASLSPQYIKVDELTANIGSSDMSMQGKIENFLAYYFNEELLKGSFMFSSNYMDLNDLTSGEMNETEEANTEEATEMAVVEIPKNIDFSLEGLTFSSESSHLA